MTANAKAYLKLTLAVALASLAIALCLGGMWQVGMVVVMVNATLAAS